MATFLAIPNPNPKHIRIEVSDEPGVKQVSFPRSTFHGRLVARRRIRRAQQEVDEPDPPFIAAVKREAVQQFGNFRQAKQFIEAIPDVDSFLEKHGLNREEAFSPGTEKTTEIE